MHDCHEWWSCAFAVIPKRAVPLAFVFCASHAPDTSQAPPSMIGLHSLVCSSPLPPPSPPLPLDRHLCAAGCGDGGGGADVRETQRSRREPAGRLCRGTATLDNATLDIFRRTAALHSSPVLCGSLWGNNNIVECVQAGEDKVSSAIKLGNEV